MSSEAHHRDALIETAAAELDRAHRGTIALEAGEVRRGLQLASKALHDAEEGDKAAMLDKALADLDDGALAEMGNLIEAVRKTLERGAT